MAKLFWTGTLSRKTKLMVDFSNAIAWVTGEARDTPVMKERMKKGYEGAVTDDVTRYDELGAAHYTKIAQGLLQGTELRGKEVLDVGCGTGILSFLCLEQGCAKVVCGDLSEYMLGRCKAKALASGYGPDRVDFQQLDAEALPFADATFDAVISGMVLGLTPNQQQVVAEMVRVLRPGGVLAISSHGPRLYQEAIEASFRTVPKRFVLGYRLEFWPRTEEDIARMLVDGGLSDVTTRQIAWRESFEDGGQAYDFYVSTSSAWWFARFPPEQVAPVSQKVRAVFESTPITEITTDVVFAYGCRR